MRYLFIIQGEGRGHLTQALTLKDFLTSKGHEVVEMLVGKSANRSLPPFFEKEAGVPVKMFLSPNFLPSSNHKRNSIFRSVVYNLHCLPQYIKSVSFINSRINNTKADIVVNFYELLCGFAYGLFAPGIPCYCIGHQYLFLHKDFNISHIKRRNLLLLNFFSRMTSIGCSRRLALSFHEMESDESLKISVVPPLLRREVLKLNPSKSDFILGYMVNPGFADEVREYHSANPQISMCFFWDKKNEPDELIEDENLLFKQIDDKAFLDKMASCRAYATTAGFESVCEAIYLGKPVLMVPAHIEQDCNAYDAEAIGAGVVSKEFDFDKLVGSLNDYQENKEFQTWAKKSEYRILPLLKPRQLNIERHISKNRARILRFINMN